MHLMCEYLSHACSPCSVEQWSCKFHFNCTITSLMDFLHTGVHSRTILTTSTIIEGLHTYAYYMLMDFSDMWVYISWHNLLHIYQLKYTTPLATRYGLLTISDYITVHTKASPIKYNYSWTRLLYMMIPKVHVMTRSLELVLIYIQTYGLWLLRS